MAARTRVLIVDDSPTARTALRLALERDREVEVVGEAQDARWALHFARSSEPDLVLMDVYLHRENGLDVAAAIMEEAPCPILVVTAVNPSDPGLVYRAVEAGALDVCAKLPGPEHALYERERRRLVELVKSLARVPVVRRRVGHSRRLARCRVSVAPAPSRPKVQVVAIGASTGGPPVVNELLRGLTVGTETSILVAQHMASGFMRGFAEWLEAGCRWPVHLVERAQPMRPGHVYLATDDRHITIPQPRVVAPSDDPPRRHHRPSIDTLLDAVARHHSSGSMAILLTGMGDDGAEGLLQVRRAGGMTIAQDPETCAVDSMPARAIGLGAAQAVLPPWGIKEALTRVLSPDRAG
jgi:two-component system chemotaxis response regulator CheB